MENRLKERLTGAAILVALIVALVPELFRGQSSAPASSVTTAAISNSSSGDGAPVRTYTIDLSNNPGSVPLRSATEPEPTQSPVATAPTPVAAQPVPPPPAAPAASASTLSSSASSTTPTPAHAARIPTAPSTNTSPTAPPARTAPGANWSVQLGLFSKRENAERLMNEARAKGFNAGISNPDGKGQFHVHVTGLTDRGAAQAMAQKLKGEGLPAAVVAP